MHPARLLLAALAVLPATAIGLYFLAGDIEALASPTWSGSQSRGEYLAMALAVKGILFAAIVVSVVGIGRGDRRVGLVGALALLVAAVPLMLGTGGLVVLLSAGMVAAVSWRPPRIGA